MVHNKRPVPEEGDGDFEVPHRDTRRRHLFRTVVGDHLTRSNFSLNEAVWEPFLRRVVREAAEGAVHSFFSASSSNSVHPAGTSSGGGTGLQLRFLNKLPPTIFTGSRVEPEDAQFIQVILMDANSQALVQSGPLSSIKIEIVAINGEFGSDDREDWTEKEFNDSILREREGRRPLVTGELTTTLREGVGRLGNNIIFTDNSSWIRSRKFRLGVRVVQKNSGDTRIREAISDPVVVKDHRGELYRKHHPPYLHDEVWRLEKIAKEGSFHKKLGCHAIHSVKDFLQMYTRDSTYLRDVILQGIASRTWNAIVEHAMRFVDDNNFYAFHIPQQGVSIHFDTIYKVVGANFNEQYFSVDEFTPAQKVLVENFKQHAYRNVNELVPLGGSSAGPPRPLASLQAQPFIDAMQHDFQVVQQDQPGTQLGLSQTTATPSLTFSGVPECSHQPVASSSHNLHPSVVFNHRNSFSLEDYLPAPYNGEPSWFPSSSQGPIVPSNHFIAENLLQVQPSTFPPITIPAWEQGPSFFFASNNDTDAGFFASIPGLEHMSRDRKRTASWCKLRAAFKCWLSVKSASRSRMARPLYLSY